MPSRQYKTDPCQLLAEGQILINKTYSVSLCVRQCQRLLHNLGFSLVRPQVFPGKGMGNEEERESFKKN